MKLEKAKISKMDENGKIVDTIEVMFNPTNYTLSKTATVAEIGIPGLDYPLLQFIRGNSEDLKIQLFLDTTDSGEDVNNYLKKIHALIDVDGDLHAPPVCQFQWGSLIFDCVLTSLTQQLLLFDTSGKPLRATVDVVFKAYRNAEIQLKKIKHSTADYTKYRTFVQGDRLSSIAGEEYRDPGMWRLIAEENNINDPLSVAPGTVLKIPRDG
jgi:nucleoid-associated protein YgaU